MALLLAAGEGQDELYLLIFVLILIPAVVLVAVIWLFFRAARRNDAREALVRQGQQPPPGS